MQNNKFDIEITEGGMNALMENYIVIKEKELEQIEKHALDRCKGSKYPAYIQRVDVEAIVNLIINK